MYKFICLGCGRRARMIGEVICIKCNRPYSFVRVQ